jgi:hypothetical protein
MPAGAEEDDPDAADAAIDTTEWEIPPRELTFGATLATLELCPCALLALPPPLALVAAGEYMFLRRWDISDWEVLPPPAPACSCCEAAVAAGCEEYEGCCCCCGGSGRVWEGGVPAGAALSGTFVTGAAGAGAPASDSSPDDESSPPRSSDSMLLPDIFSPSRETTLLLIFNSSLGN